MKMGFLDTLPVVSLRVGQAKQAFLQEVADPPVSFSRSGPTTSLDLLFSIPESKGNILQRMGIRYTGDSILAPAESPRARMVVGEIFPVSGLSSQLRTLLTAPGITILGIILSHCRPLALCHVGTPFLPVLGSFPVFLEPLLFLGEEFMSIDQHHGGWLTTVIERKRPNKRQTTGKWRKVEKLEEVEEKNREWGRGKLLRPQAAQRVVTAPQGRALGDFDQAKKQE
jgi:hypothetical protein